MEFLKNLKKITKRDAALAGVQGTLLGEMARADIPVVPGFVVLTTAFERFLEKTDIGVELDTILHTVDRSDVCTADAAAGRIQALMRNAEMPRDLAREMQKCFEKLDADAVTMLPSVAENGEFSSMGWVSQLQSFPRAGKEELVESVKKCWASLFTPRTILYYFAPGLHVRKPGVAIVVQKTPSAEALGVAFSAHPLTQDRNQVVIETAARARSNIAAHHRPKDRYVVEKEPRRILDKNISARIFPAERTRQALADKKILELADLVCRTEAFFGVPCEIEWIESHGEFFVTAARPMAVFGAEGVTAKTPHDRAALPARRTRWHIPSVLAMVRKFVAETGKTILVSLAVVWLVRSFIVQPFYVRGASMEPNFDDGEYLIINEIGYRFEKPQRGDVVVFRYPLDPSEYFIKRIVGMPGEEVAIEDGKVLINRKELVEPYLAPGVFTYGKTGIALGEGEYYVLGDNRAASSDSRRWGVLPARNIVGRAWFRGWPLKHAGLIPQETYNP